MTQGISYQCRLVSLNSVLHVCLCVWGNCKLSGSDTIMPQPTACYSRQAWQRPWALVDNHNCLHQLSRYMCGQIPKGCWLGMTILQKQINKWKIPHNSQLVIIRDIIKEHDDNRVLWEIWKAWENHCNFYHHCQICQQNQYLAKWGWTQQRSLSATVRHVLSKCHGYMWTFPPRRDKFMLSYREALYIAVSICSVFLYTCHT